MIIWAPWTDLAGYTTEVTFYTFGSSGASAILAQMAPISNAYSEVWYHAMPEPPVAPGSLNPASNVLDVADLVFRASSDGSAMHLWVPSPHNGIFLGDGETVNPAAIAALIAAVIANASTPNGIPVDTYVQGFRKTLHARNFR